MAYAAALRSPHAHARIGSIDKSAAEALPGVVAVITGEEAARESGPLPCFANPPVEQRCIALGKVRHVGEPVVLVVADSRYIAEDAIALINVVYEPLPAVSDMMEAISAATRCSIPSAARTISPSTATTSSARSSRNSPAPPT